MPTPPFSFLRRDPTTAWALPKSVHQRGVSHQALWVPILSAWQVVLWYQLGLMPVAQKRPGHVLGFSLIN